MILHYVTERASGEALLALQVPETIRMDRLVEAVLEALEKGPEYQILITDAHFPTTQEFATYRSWILIREEPDKMVIQLTRYTRHYFLDSFDILMSNQ